MDRTPKPHDRRWLVTGADGFLGNTIVAELVARGERVRAGVFGRLDPAALADVDCERVRLDVINPVSVQAALAGDDPRSAARTIVVHTAGIVSIDDKVNPILWTTNVEGTQNVIDACRAAMVSRLVYISSMHALPEPGGRAMREISEFRADSVQGAYAKTKAEATRRVLAANDLDKVVIHPAGVIGPGDFGDTAMSRLVRDLAENRLPAVIRGGYYFVDVRDVAAAVITAAELGRDGDCFLLSAGRVSITEIARIISDATGSRMPLVLPRWAARLMTPLVGADARRRGVRAILTKYALDVVSSNYAVSCDKAATELGFDPRPLRTSILDTLEWTRAHPSGVAQG